MINDKYLFRKKQKILELSKIIQFKSILYATDKGIQIGNKFIDFRLKGQNFSEARPGTPRGIIGQLKTR